MGSFPHAVDISYGDEKVSQSTRISGLGIGAIAVLPDGREFVHAKASATALIAGKIYEQVATVNSLFQSGATLVNSTVIGDTTVVITVSGTVLAADEYKDGYLYVASTVGTGGGIIYKIKGHLACSSTANVTLNLYPNDKIKVAMNASTATIGLKRAVSDSLLLVPAGTADTGALAGVAVTAVTASYFCWLQRKGPAAVFTDATVIVGQPVVCSSAIAGACAPFISSTTANWRNQSPIGYCMQVAASTGFSLIDLSIQ